MDLIKSLRNLEAIGRRHIELTMEDYDMNAYDALKGFIRSCFYRGRSDKTSKMYIEYAIKAVDSLCENINGDSEKVKFLNHKGDRLVKKYTKLVNKHQKVHQKRETVKQVTKPHPTDVMLLNSICDDFIEDLEGYDYNIRKYCTKFFEEKELECLYNRLDEIEGVGQKLASLYIRDLLAYYEESHPESRLKLSKLNKEDMWYVYPVDTWVKQITEKIDGKKFNSNRDAMDWIVEKCEPEDLSPAYVNHGIWYIGSNSSQFLIDNLDKLDGLTVKTK